jgi:hypothetical protein
MQELHINKLKYISPYTTHFCSSNYNNIISVSSDSPFFRRSFYNALSGQPHVHVNYLFFTFFTSTIGVREPRLGHPSNITLKDVTRVNVRRKYIKYSKTFLSDEQEATKCSLLSRSNIFAMPKQKHAAARVCFGTAHFLAKCTKAVINIQLNHTSLCVGRLELIKPSNFLPT